MRVELETLKVLDDSSDQVVCSDPESCVNVNSGGKIAEFFRGRSVFITGGTGFLGKVLVEKLLRSCPGISTIYLLMRSNNQSNLEERLLEFKRNRIFQRLQSEGDASALDKLVAVRGDVTCERLGLDDATGVLCDVSVVFHCAASVRFNEPLRRAVLLNTRGTREVTRLAMSMRALEVLVHVSTAYCNPDRAVMDEEVYPAYGDYRHVIECVENACEDDLQHLTRTLLGDLPNTYVFSKSLAEHVVYEQRGVLPAAIFRPSIVCPAYSEPVPGWVDSRNGPMGLLVGASAGMLRSVKGDGNKKTDLLPVDFAINAMITAAWHTAVSKRYDIPVFNCTTSSEVAVTWNQFIELGLKEYSECPSLQAVWYPGGAIRGSALVHLMCFFFLQLIPAALLDAFLLLSLKKPWLLKAQMRIFTSLRAIEFFICKEWTFRNSNLRSLLSFMTPDDKKEFNFEASKLDLQEYIKRWVLGLRRFIMKLDDSSIPEARMKFKRLFWMHQLLLSVVCVFMLYMLVTYVRSNNMFGVGTKYIPVYLNSML
ncbi:putative fatty acyl-CoA reductase CG5065 [Periplaneta americana]|uniref:putative fatty acyl-CoA reductase CG5065 n=1 Tax=Periplaneta americana TaxID=6978 RepID=UPI0037E7CC08